MLSKTKTKKGRTGRFIAIFLVIIIALSAVRSSSNIKQLFSKKVMDDSGVGITCEMPQPRIVPDQCVSPLRFHFDKIYKKGTWGNTLRQASDFYSDAAWPPRENRKKSASGSGSDLGGATENSLQVIKDAISKYSIKSMIDIPCGDVNWVFDSIETDTLPLYIGLDIVSAVIDINKRRFDHHKNKHFRFWDATLCPLPKYNNGSTNEEHSFDLVHVRDVIQHITLDQGVRYFCNVFTSGAKVLITTTYPKITANRNITEGDWYKNNLMVKPFSFPEGNCTPSHKSGIEDDVTCVYNLAEDWVQQFTLSKCNM